MSASTSDKLTPDVTDSVFSPLLPAAGAQTDWYGLAGDSLPLAIVNAARRAPGILLVVTPDMQATEMLSEQAAFYRTQDDPPVLTLPDWESLPYDRFSPHQDIISGRLATLYRLPALHNGLLIVPVTTLAQRLPPPAFIDANSLVLRCGEQLELQALRERLDRAGYACVSQVMEHGEFAVRGSLLDIFPMGGETPYRIDLFDTEIESIRSFDPDSQRSRQQHGEIRLLPAREFPMDEAAIRLFRQRFRASFPGDPQASSLYRDVSQGIAPPGIEYYLPLFVEQCATLFDYLPAATTILLQDAAGAACEAFTVQVQERYEAHRHDLERPILAPDALYLEWRDIESALATHTRITVHTFRGGPGRHAGAGFNVQLPENVRFHARGEQPAAALSGFLASYQGRVLFTAESTGRREALLEQLRASDIRPQVVDHWQAFADSDLPLAITVAPLEAGFVSPAPALAVITETQLHGERARQTRRRRPTRDPAAVIRNLSDLEIGAPVVHEEHGVGRYLGLESIAVGTIVNEYLALSYAGGDKLYVPVGSLELVSRYTGASAGHAPLHKLGSGQWQKARRKATERIRDVAAELLDIYARRAARTGNAFPPPQDDYAAFASTFPFEETPDQEQAIAAVLRDMQAPVPMDRLVCGDVGFGKTEVAMRAAFVAVQAGRQVALLVPTTLLAQQHYRNFTDRFADWPVNIALLSRFRSHSEQQTTLAELASGKVDIVIGTHKLLQTEVRFRRLGLLVIDEEHRFGVRQKEKIKSLRAAVDILTLTATPIPRTLNMSLSGLRDLSIISTPPPNRLTIKTFVCEWDRTLIREACLREIKRGGQVYFLHNEVDTIARMAQDLSAIVPEAVTAIAHGQMRERELEKVMLDFYHRRFNVLVCSTIVESGIDVPSANTIIMNRADRLGLAQLHQLRGRVGRSHHRAYAYLIVPPMRAMSADAVKRLAAIESMEALGAGFTLATHDLEIRGAGELLGEDQSGQIHEIGFALYTDLLERAVAAMRRGEDPQLDQPLHRGPEIDLMLPALIPDDYIPDVHTRLVLYKRIAGCSDSAALDELQVELIDRFGLLPAALKNLFRITAIKLRAAPLGITRIELGGNEGRILFSAAPAIDTERLIHLIQTQPEHFRLDGPERLRIYAAMETEGMRFDKVAGLLDLLTP